MPTIPPPLPTSPHQDVRVRIFVDFWNFQIRLTEWDSVFKLDWKKLGPWLAQQAGAEFLAAGQLGRATYEGLHVYISYDPRKSTDEGLRRWASNTLDRFPGVQVCLKERRRKDPPKCPMCHVLVDICPHCGKSMKGTVEKGIDTAIVTDMIRLAWEESWDIAVLVSADRDFVPAVEFLGQKGRKVINAAFPPKGMELSKKCWATFDVTKGIRAIARE